MGVTAAESLADSFAKGTYPPSVLDDCSSAITLDQSPQFIRFTEFTLFASSNRRPPDWEVELLIAQPQVVARMSDAQQRRIRDQQIRPVVQRAMRELPTARLPAPDAKASEIRDALEIYAGELERDGAQYMRARSRQISTAASRDLPSRATPSRAFPSRDLPSRDLPDPELRKAYRTWLSREETRLIRASFDPLVEYRLVPKSTTSFGPRDVDAIVDHFAQVFFPGPFQPFDSAFTQIALCATFEQEWRLTGYTRGELVSSLSLAPGEQLTLEVHTWDKSSRKSEDELATESEVRASEKLTQRDALTVAQEFSRQKNTSVNVNGTIPIPKMPLSAGANVTTETRESLRRTQESVRERTVEASNSLRVNRKTKIEIARETGREERQTRVVQNTNRCHSLNCFYFEVIANYLVTTRLVSVEPCLLVASPKPDFDAGWVLCHEDVLVKALLDKTFLPGFDAAHLLETGEELTRIAEERAAAALEQAGEDVAPLVTAVVAAFQGLRETRDFVAATIADCGGPSDSIYVILCIMAKLTASEIEQTATWFSLTSRTRTALSRLEADQQNNENAAVALKRYLSVVPPSDFAYDVPEEALRSSLRDFGIPPNLVGKVLEKAPATRDDGQLRAADEAARAVLATLPEADASESQIPLRELADATVAFNQLICHLKDNWLHYMQMVRLRENHDQRYLRLQSDLGDLAPIIENELLGFYADKAAYRLRTTKNLQDEIDFDKVLEEARKIIDRPVPEPTLISFPTAGTILEAVTGACDGCEDFIHKSRIIDLRLQSAKADQEQAEADRREQRVTQGDLSDPHPQPPSKLVIEVQQPPPPPSGSPQ